MTEDQTSLSMIAEVLDVLDRHGYTRGDNEHTARAIVLISDLARIYQGSLDHPFGPYIKDPPSRTEPAPARPAVRDIVVLSASEIRTVIAALDDASVYKRDRVEMCIDCDDRSCGSCQWRLQAAGAYHLLAAQLDDAAQAWRSASASQSQPAADREAGQ